MLLSQTFVAVPFVWLSIAIQVQAEMNLEKLKRQDINYCGNSTHFTCVHNSMCCRKDQNCLPSSKDGCVNQDPNERDMSLTKCFERKGGQFSYQDIMDCTAIFFSEKEISLKSRFALELETTSTTTPVPAITPSAIPRETPSTAPVVAEQQCQCPACDGLSKREFYLTIFFTALGTIVLTAALILLCLHCKDRRMGKEQEQKEQERKKEQEQKEQERKKEQEQKRKKEWTFHYDPVPTEDPDETENKNANTSSEEHPEERDTRESQDHKDQAATTQVEVHQHATLNDADDLCESHKGPSSGHVGTSIPYDSDKTKDEQDETTPKVSVNRDQMPPAVTGGRPGQGGLESNSESNQEPKSPTTSMEEGITWEPRNELPRRVDLEH